MRVLVAMSGGVDSSVAAYLLKSRGLKVIGLSFELWDDRNRRDPSVCCSVETIDIARKTAQKLGIEHYTVDVRDAFYRYIIEEFCSGYIRGITPNPCVLCNKFIKFRFLLEKAEEIGAETIATGHYARIERPAKPRPHERVPAPGKPIPGQGDNRALLKKGLDPNKDQSYVLYVMTQGELFRTEFPLGEFQKEQTRKIAREQGLASALRPESQEICFIGEGRYGDFIKSFAPDLVRPGPVLTKDGKVIGEHRGIAFYTIGQRKRLGLQGVTPHYVTSINRQKNEVVVGSRQDVMKKTLKVGELNWIGAESLSGPMRVSVKIRSTMREADAMIIPLKNQMVAVEFDESQWAPAPGQSAVFYKGDRVIGGGVIT